MLAQNIDGLVVRPILKSDDVQTFTSIRTTDVRTAMARGLAEYLADKSIIWEGGRRFAFANVFATWAEGEVPAEYPAAVIVGTSPMVYEDAELTPGLIQVRDSTDGDNFYFRQVAGVRQTFDIEIWAVDPAQRMALTAMVEDVLEPTDFMTGLRLELPYYFSSRATYEKMTMAYMDSPSDAQRRWRKAVITVDATCGQFVPVGRLVMMQHRCPVILVDSETDMQGMIPATGD